MSRQKTDSVSPELPFGTHPIPWSLTREFCTWRRERGWFFCIPWPLGNVLSLSVSCTSEMSCLGASRQKTDSVGPELPFGTHPIPWSLTREFCTWRRERGWSFCIPRPVGNVLSWCVSSKNGFGGSRIPFGIHPIPWSLTREFLAWWRESR